MKRCIYILVYILNIFIQPKYNIYTCITYMLFIFIYLYNIYNMLQVIKPINILYIRHKYLYNIYNKYISRYPSIYEI